MILFVKSNPIKLTLLRLHDMHLTNGRILNRTHIASLTLTFYLLSYLYQLNQVFLQLIL